MGGGVSTCGICDNISVKSGLCGGVWPVTWTESGVGVEGGLSAYGICDNIFVNPGLGGGVLSSLGTFVEPPSYKPDRFCDAAVTSRIAFASRRTSGLLRTAAGAASAKLMMERIRRVRESILCCRIFVGCVT